MNHSIASRVEIRCGGDHYRAYLLPHELKITT